MYQAGKSLDDDDDGDERSDMDEISPTSGRDSVLGPPTLLNTTRTIVVSLFLPCTVSADPSPPKYLAPTAAIRPTGTGTSGTSLERRRSVGAVEFKRQRKVSESRGLRPDPGWWHLESSGLGNIGLQNSVNSMRKRMREPLWIGTLGVSTMAWSEDTKQNVRTKLAEERNCVPVYLTDGEVEGHYNQFCKQVLWKPFHYQLRDYPKGEAYEEQAWQQYVAVNQKFADAIAKSHQQGDIVWINDYHLMLVPAMVRRLIPGAIIGFFLHIPFPSSEIFRCLHVRKQILEGMLGADMIGFQTYPFMRHFLMTCTRLLALESTPRGVQLEDRVVSVVPIPIGIDLGALNEKRAHPEVAEIVASLKERYAGMKVLIGRDKNDYVKGVRQKMLAFERFLKDYPEWVGKVVLIQVALSTTEANENECRVSDVVARINSRYGSIEYHPVVYLQQDISFSHYLALWTIADACVITSLRDGMNLTSHEFIVCQEQNRGPLIISEFAGTYGSFGAALRVNPWDVKEVSEAIQDALTMSDEEKDFRWKELYSHVIGNTGQTYVETFTNELFKAHEEVTRTVSTSIPALPEEVVLAEYVHSRKRIFFLDQDGTIMNFNKHSSTTLLSSRIPTTHVVDVVRKLASDRRNIVYIMSGRCKSEMEDFIGLPNVGLCAENGCYLKYANRNAWETMLPDHDLSWRKQVMEIFEYYTDRTPGSYIEQKEIGMVWHYGHADMNFGSWQAAECQNHLEQALTTSYAIHVLGKKRSLEVMPRNVNKGSVIRRVLEHHQGRGQQSRRANRPHSIGISSGVVAQDAAGKRRSFSGATFAEPESDMTTSSHTRQRSEDSGFLLDEARDSDLTSVESAPTGGSLFESVLPTRERVDFILCLGDDRADEYMFEYLRRLEMHSNKKELRSEPATPFDELRMFGAAPWSSGGFSVRHPAPATFDETTFSPVTSPPESPAAAYILSQPSAVSFAARDQFASPPNSDPHHTLTPPTHTLSDRTVAAITSLPNNFELEFPIGRVVPNGANGGGSQGTASAGTTRGKRCVITATIGKKSSAAKWCMTGPQEVLTLLERLVDCEKTHKGGRSTVPQRETNSSPVVGPLPSI
ncbi:hypothetical protein HKX48_003301 [Thoreauomyces humboldtii]|nr:hypothetical protein HKX48_003301 [Thoreauomyces humboldtii]